MATVKSKILIRQGSLSDLPILEAGEQGYAVDAQRLFIGNKPVFRDGDGLTQEFNFGVDLDVLETTYQRYEIWVNGTKLNNSSYVVKDDGMVVTISPAPSAGVSNVVLYHNTEILTSTPDKENDPTTTVILTSDNTIPELSIDENRYNNGEIKYTLRNTATNDTRTGTIRLAITNGTAIVSDSYDTTSETVLPHEFNATMTGSFLVISYSTTVSDPVSFSYVTNLWKS